jgi:hypothetical protein
MPAARRIIVDLRNEFRASGAVADGSHAAIEAASARQPVEQRRADDDAETAIGQILEFNALPAPNFFNCVNGRSSRLGVAVFELVNGPLGQADVDAKFAFNSSRAPPAPSAPWGKSAPLEPHELDRIAGVSCSMNCHRRPHACADFF